jgi:putative transcriptional regulator
MVMGVAPEGCALLSRQKRAPIKAPLADFVLAALAPRRRWAFRIGMTAHHFLTGRVLIAMPGIDDPRFERALILMCAHGADHAMGLALNRPVEGLSTPGLLHSLGVEPNYAMAEQPVLIGGPVDRERGFVVHTDDYICAKSSVPIAEGLAWTATRDVLEAMADSIRRPRHALLALGYAGWGAGQLEREMHENVWLTCEPDDGLLFGTDYDLKWTKALAKIGVSPGALSSYAGRA